MNVKQLIEQFDSAKIEKIFQKKHWDSDIYYHSLKIVIHEDSEMKEGILFEVFPNASFFPNQLQIDGYYYPKTKKVILNVFSLNENDDDDFDFVWQRLDKNEPRYKEIKPFINHVHLWAKTYFEKTYFEGK